MQEYAPAGTAPNGFSPIGVPLFDARTGAAEVNTLGYTFTVDGKVHAVDSVYRFEYTIPHTADALSLAFKGSGLQAASDESWGLDNVRVSVSGSQRIGGTVWNDLDSNGVWVDSEAGVAGVGVALFDANMGFIEQTGTDESGEYEFVNLPGGEYFVRVYEPFDHSFSAMGMGGNASTDSDFNPATGLTNLIQLSGGVSLPVDAGVFVSWMPPTPTETIVIITEKGGGTTGILRVAKWEEVFTDGGRAIVAPDKKTGHDFIDLDPDRFNVRVYDLAEWTANTATVDESLKTTNVEGFTKYDDPNTSLRLVRMASHKGWYWSDSQILVSNEADHKYADARVGEDESAPGATTSKKEGHEFPIQDQTHRIALRGTVTATYGDAKAATATVSVAGVVHVHTTILKVNAADAKGVISVDDAKLAIGYRGNELYAQAGILLIPTFQTVNPPTDKNGNVTVDLSNGLSEYPDKLVDGKLALTDEEKSLLGHAAFRTEVVYDVEPYFVNSLSANSAGEAFPDLVVPHAKYADSVIVATKDIEPLAVPHEIMHLLTNERDHYKVDYPYPRVNLFQEYAKDY